MTESTIHPTDHIKPVQTDSDETPSGLTSADAVPSDESPAAEPASVANAPEAPAKPPPQVAVPQHAAPPAAKAPPPQVRRGGTPFWFTCLLFVAMSGGMVYVFKHPPPQDSPREAALEAEVKALQSRLAQLEQKPQPDLAPLVAPVASRVSAVEAAIRSLSDRTPAAQTDIVPLTARIDALERKGTPDVSAPIAAATKALGARIDALEARFSTEITKVTASAAVATRLSAVAQALENGQKLGDLPGAPAALAKFAQTAPPTEASLRLRFPDAARAAEAASKPNPGGRDFLQRMWDRTQGLLTVSQGGHVLLGAPAAVTLAAARVQLEAGDLAGTLGVLAKLDAPAAAAMAGWTRDAQALLDARTALAAMAKS